MSSIDRPIIWIASYPKSGNTWVRLFLDAWFTGSLHLDRPMLFNHHHRDYYMWQRLIARPVSDCTPLEVAHAWPNFYAHCSVTKRTIQTANGRRLLMKTHHLYGREAHIPTIPAGLTDRAIYIVRDPRDVALSLANHTGQSVASATEFMCHHKASMPANFNVPDPFPDYCGSWNINVKTWTEPSDQGGPPFPVHVVKYEDLLADPVGEFRAMLNFIGCWQDDNAAHPGQLERCVGLTSIVNLQAQEADVGYIGKPPAAERFFQHGRSHWQDDLRQGFAQRLADAHGPTMRKFGYLGNETARESANAAAL